MAETTPVDASTLGGLKWPDPANSVSPPVPLDELLRGLQLLATDEARKEACQTTKWDSATPASMQVIKSGALQITQTGTKLIAGAGGGAGFLAAILAVVVSIIEGVGEPVTIALIASAAVLLSAVAIALALFVSGDLEARGLATAARHQARAHVASSFLAGTQMLTQVAPLEEPATEVASRVQQKTSMVNDMLFGVSSFPRSLKVSTAQYPNLQAVKGVRRRDEEHSLELRLENDDWIGVDEVKSFATSTD